MNKNQKISIHFANDNEPLIKKTKSGGFYHAPQQKNLQARGRAGFQEETNSQLSTEKLISTPRFSSIKPGVIIERPYVKSNESRGRKNAGNNKNTPNTNIKKNPEKKKPLSYLALSLLSLLILASLASLGFAQLTSLQFVMSGLAIGAIALFTSIAAQKLKAKIIHSLALSASSIGFAIAIWSGIMAIGFVNAAEIFTIILIASSLLMTKLLSSPYFIGMSALVMMAWAGLSLPAGQMSDLSWLFPALWSVHFYMALKTNSARMISISSAAGFMWIGVIIATFL